MSTRWFGIAGVLGLAVGVGTAGAVPITLSHQARILDDIGSPVQGNHTITARFWSNASSTDLADRHSEELFSVDVSGGFVSLGLSVDSDWFSAPIWLGLEIDGEGELAPRSLLVDVPTASVARVAAGVALESEAVEGDCVPGSIVFNTSNDSLRTGLPWPADRADEVFTSSCSTPRNV